MKEKKVQNRSVTEHEDDRGEDLRNREESMARMEQHEWSS